MRDHDYKVVTTYHSRRHQAMRRALYGSIVPAPVLNSGNLQEMQDYVYGVWRAKLDELYAYGWDRFSRPYSRSCQRNCPPIGAKTVPEFPKTCKLRQVCPWCFTRDTVGDCYDRLAAYCFPAGVKRCDRTLIEFSTRETFVPVIGYGESHWLEALHELYRSRHTELDYGPQPPHRLGAFLLHTFHRRDRHVCYRRRGILITTGKSWKTAPHNLDVVSHTDFSSKELVEVVARVCRYPLPVLTQTAEELASMLGITTNKRLKEYYGVLRGKPQIASGVEE